MNVIAPERPIHEGERIIMLFDLISSDLASMGHYLENSPFTKLVLARTAHNEVTSSSHIRTHIILFWVEQRFSAANIEIFFFVIPSGPFRREESALSHSLLSLCTPQIAPVKMPRCRTRVSLL